MTAADLYLLTGLGFLLAMDTSGRASLFSERRGMLPKALRHMTVDFLYLAFAPALFVLFQELFRAFLMPLDPGDAFAVLFLFALSGLFSLILRKSPVFSLAVFMVAFRGLALPEGDLPARIITLPALAAGASIFRFFLTGLREKMLLADTADAVKGLPVLFLLTAALAFFFQVLVP